MSYLAQQALNALQLGSIYALIALGYTMVYGVLTMINFAHGDVFMAGAFLCFIAGAFLRLPVALALLFSIAGTAPLGALVARVRYPAPPEPPRLSAVLTPV